MTYPRLEIDIAKLEANVRTEVALLAGHGVSVMGVNKVFNGMVETAEALVRGGITVVAESRLANLKKLAHLKATKCLLRSPALSEVEDVVAHADLSLNSELEVLRALSRAAVAQGRIHQVLLMVDCGDIREGLWFEDRDAISATLRELLALPGLALYGLGTNFNCFGSVLPTVENGAMFVALARSLEAELGIRFPVLSGGHCTSYHLIDKGTWVPGINQLRIGGLHQYGIEYVEMKYVEGFHHSTLDAKLGASPLYTLKAEIIELNTKPTVPFGALGTDAFLQTKTFVDRGPRRRALLAFGRQDAPYEGCWPTDRAVTIIGQTSDHTIVDLEDSADDYQLGDVIGFELDYTSLLHACDASGVTKVAIGSEVLV